MSLMNPLNLYGPQFLFFYVLVGIGTIAWAFIRLREIQQTWPVPKLDLNDPYEIAYLRGGQNEVARIAVLALLKHGVLKHKKNKLSPSKNTQPVLFDIEEDSGSDVESSQQQSTISGRPPHLKKPIEAAVVEFFQSSRPAYEVFSMPRLADRCSEYYAKLCSKRLLASDLIFKDRFPVIGIASAIIGGLAFLKIIVAILSGRSNVGFLIIFAAAFVAVLWFLFRRDPSELRNRVLSDLRTLCAGMRPSSGSSKPLKADEAILLAAIYGIGALPAADYKVMEKLFNKSVPPSSNTTSDSGYGYASGCSSSCGAACGSNSSDGGSGSGGDGGGGGDSSCGGGCGGGCGGCGS